MSQSRRKTTPQRRKVVTTVNLEPEVLDYLRELQAEFDRDRSYLVNALVKEYRRRRQLPAAMTASSEVFAKQLSA
jgi:predicted transcriptional regulator